MTDALTQLNRMEQKAANAVQKQSRTTRGLEQLVVMRLGRLVGWPVGFSYTLFSADHPPKQMTTEEALEWLAK